MLKAFIPAICALIIAIPMHSQTFKGHQIGESTNEFLQIETAIGAKLVDCQKNVPRELTPDEIKQKLGKKGYETYLKQEGQYNAEGKHIQYFDQDPDVYGDRCEALLNAMAFGAGSIDGTGYEPSNPYAIKIDDNILKEMRPMPVREHELLSRSFTFKGGVLVSFGIHVASSYESIRDDVTNRLGAPPIETRIPYQNAFGAKWDAVTATWTTDRLSVQLSDDNNPAKPSIPWLVIKDSLWEQERKANAPKPPSPLD